MTLVLIAACTGSAEPGPLELRGPVGRAPGAPGATTPATPAPIRLAPAGTGGGPANRTRAPARPGPAPAGEAPASALARSAQALLDVSATRRDALAFGFDSDEREDWNYVPRSRAGLAIGDMTQEQRAATDALLRAGLSPRGFEKVEGIQRIEPILGQIEGNPGFRDPGRYHVAIFGQPGHDRTWGWRFEGHHLSLNFTLVAGQVASTPAFFGANPARVSAGRHAGLRVLASEEDLGRALLNSLSPEQRRRAILSPSAPTDIVTEASRRVSLKRFEGLPAADMTQGQRAALRRLIEVYVRNFHPELARTHLERIEAAGVARIYFAWAGSAEPRRAHYYRLHGPTHVIEYDNRGGNHIHTVFRDLQHDFGDGLLARHLHEHHRGESH